MPHTPSKIRSQRQMELLPGVWVFAPVSSCSSGEGIAEAKARGAQGHSPSLLQSHRRLVHQNWCGHQETSGNRAKSMQTSWAAFQEGDLRRSQSEPHLPPGAAELQELPKALSPRGRAAEKEEHPKGQRTERLSMFLAESLDYNPNFQRQSSIGAQCLS